jgi:drug/metabolite transporter (DMT)-like permease
MRGRFCRWADTSAHDGENLTVREFLFLFLIVVAGTSGELCVTHAMKRAGEVTDFRPAAIARFISRAMRVGWMWIGVGMMTLSFFSLLAMLSIENVSFVVPVTALSYAAGTLGAVVFLRERVSPERWLGVVMVCFGVTLVWLSRR